MKRRRNRFARLGVLPIVLLLALCLTGVGYGAWTDTVYIEGTITTGTWYEGCSHGYWKNHEDAWEATGYNTTDTFNDIFGCTAFPCDLTLMNALWQGGGGINALGREAVAALLNAAHPGVDYPLTPREVIQKVQLAIEHHDYESTKDELEEYNAYAIGGCPL